MLNRVMWEGRLLPGKSEEYIERHYRIWPEMFENLKLQGKSATLSRRSMQRRKDGRRPCRESSISVSRIHSGKYSIWNKHI